MNIKKISEEMDNINIDDIKLAKESISPIEVERTNNYIREITGKRKNRKKLISVASIAIILVLGVSPISPLAKEIPIINNLYKELGIFSGYEEYTNFIGMYKEENGYKLTVDNIVATKDKLIIAMNLYSKIDLKMIQKVDNIMANVSMNVDGVNGSSGGTDIYYKDKNNAVIVYTERIDGEYKSQGNLKLNVSKMSEDFMKEEFNIEFDMPIDFTKSFKETKSYKINKDVTENCKVAKIQTTIMGTDIDFSSQEIKDNIESKIFNNYEVAPKLYLEVDGILHFYDTTNLYEFNTVTSEVYKDAEEVNLIVVSNCDEGLDGKDDSNSIKLKMIKKGNINYPDKIKSKAGKIGEITKINIDGNKVSFLFESDFESLGILNSARLVGKNENGSSSNVYLGTGHKVEEGYVLEYLNVDTSKELKLTFLAWEEQLDNYLDVKKVKIK